MNWLVLLYYPALIFLLLFGLQRVSKGSFNKYPFSLRQAKALQGFAAVCVMFHHIAQNTCAPWLSPEDKIHGLNPFVPVGYLFVALFFFCSGYGLMKSHQTKENYLKDFFIRRALRPVLILVASDIILVLLSVYFPDTYLRNSMVTIPTPFNMGGAVLINDYSWFIYALLFMYLAFWLSFRIIKKSLAAMISVSVMALLYMGFCDWWMYGSWWYNVILLFPLGLFFAVYEKKLFSLMEKKYPLLLILSLISLPLFFCLGEYGDELRSLTGITYHYFTEHWILLLSQTMAGIVFIFLLLLAGMKLTFSNRALTLYGSITVEFYLIHILWLRIIGTSRTGETLFAIENLALYVLVILLLSTAFATGFFYLSRLISGWVAKKPLILKLIKKDFIVLGCIAFAFLIYSVFCLKVRSDDLAKSRKNDLETFRNENITYTEVDGLRMSTYVVGEGAHTVVLLGGIYDVSSTISLRPLANRLSEQNRVVVLDYFGCGFSDDTTEPRTAGRYVYEIRTALSNLGIEGPYILMPSEISALYALLYATEYPAEVEAIIALDGAVSAQQEDVVADLKLTPESYQTRLKRQQIGNEPLHAFYRYTGIDRTTWFMMERFFKYSQSENTLPLLEEHYHQHWYNHNHLDAYARVYDNHKQLAGVTYPETLPVLSILGSQSCEGIYFPESDWQALHNSLITNPEIQEIKVLPGNPYFAFYQHRLIADEAQVFINNLP